jgi:hypothetical protein
MTTEAVLSTEEQNALMTSALKNLERRLCEIRLLTSSGNGPIPLETQIYLNRLADALHNIPQIVVAGLIEKDAGWEQWANSELQRSIDASLELAMQHAAFEDVLYGQASEPTLAPVEAQS